MIKLWPSSSHDGGSLIAGSNRARGSASGGLHILMLDYGFTVPGVLADVPEHLIKLHAEMVYNGGFHPRAQNVDQDWSHAVFGASTDFDLVPNVTLTPAVYYQMTMEDRVNPDSDELWVSLGLRYSF